jgi:ElaB/YqjD/DUF883 family membrane-anchored ribosome-binding protein
MPKAEVHQRIQELLDELEQIDTEEAAARERLTQVLRDIRDAIEATDGAVPDRSDSLIERLNDATRQFEESHPTLTAMVGRVAESLSNLGI